MNIRTRISIGFAIFATASSLAMMAAPKAVAGEYSGDPYTLGTCPVSGEKLGADAVTTVLTGMSDKSLDGTQVKFCCNKCMASFKSEPSKYVPKMNEAIAKAAPAYPLKTCIVMSGDQLDADATTFVWQNRVYKFCCPKCVSKFQKDPAKYCASYEKQVSAAQKPTYKATTCPISGKPLGDGAVDVVVSGHLVRTCCPGCVDAVKADPKSAIAKVEGSPAAQPAPAVPADPKK
ncbi:MAG: TRASH domain-containing protein [Planctomycetota bacterium]|nr:MAG: TRASH domain-containing protein [Planctomycetota bacterium]